MNITKPLYLKKWKITTESRVFTSEIDVLYSQWLLFKDELLKVDDNVVATGRRDPGQTSGVIRVGVGKARAGDHCRRAQTQVTTQGDVPVARVLSFWGSLRLELGRLGSCEK